MHRSVLVVGSFAGTALLGASLHAATLWNNGSVVTSPNGGTETIAGQALSSADIYRGPGGNISTVGVVANHSAPSAVAENFTVPAGGWDLDSLTVYALQTSQLVPTASKVWVNLWPAAPFSADSPEPHGALPTPILSAPLELAAGPGTFVAHRQGGSETNRNRPIFSYTVSLDGLPNAGVLPEGEYWIEWSYTSTTSPTAQMQTPLVTPRDTDPQTPNARLYNVFATGQPRAWFTGFEGFINGVDPGRPYSLPFILNGSAVPEPSSLAVISIAGATLARRRKRA